MLKPAIFRAALRRCPKGVSGTLRLLGRSIVFPLTVDIITFIQSFVNPSAE